MLDFSLGETRLVEFQSQISRPTLSPFPNTPFLEEKSMTFLRTIKVKHKDVLRVSDFKTE